MQNHYLQALKENLIKKEAILSQLIDDCEQQKLILSEPEINWGSFDMLVDVKDQKIKQLTSLDTSFETLFEHVKEELQVHSGLYASDIKEIKTLITRVSEKSVGLETLEQRNYALTQKTFSNEKRKLGSSITAGRAAQAYHNNMNRLNLVDPQLMDKKK